MFSSNSGDTKNSQLNGPGLYFVQSVTEFSEGEIAEHYPRSTRFCYTYISKLQDIVGMVS